ncbi:hypothetical protein HGRIS_010578 [Hohenbuehelia grisea]|uniref:Uncharacterized protein n=1 Tax=Hohenbuehelia grisea TaxID=104357 RepID=A0ABR3IXH8_9AGAR
MAWTDVFAFVATLSFLGAVIYGVIFVSKQVSQGVESTKEALKEKGLHISDKGVSVKTSKRFDREDYVDATQRGIIKAMGAASFGNQNGAKSPVLDGTSSNSSRSHKLGLHRKSGKRGSDES